jgi:transcriptional regulator with XRE-family HTH domain
MDLHKSAQSRKKSVTLTGSVVYSRAVVQPDAKTRVRQRIKRLLEDRGRTQRELAQWLGHGDQWVSNLLAGRHALSWTDLDRVAEFLKVPPGEIVRVSDEPWELAPTEMRMVRALRMLPPTVRDHLVTMADYLIGTTPEEVDELRDLRELTPENRQLVRRWTQVTLRTQRENEPGQLTPDDLRVPDGPRDAPARRTRRGRPGQ